MRLAPLGWECLKCSSGFLHSGELLLVPELTPNPASSTPFMPPVFHCLEGNPTG